MIVNVNLIINTKLYTIKKFIFDEILNKIFIYYNFCCLMNLIFIKKKRPYQVFIDF